AETQVDVAALALDVGLWHKRADGIDNQNIDGAAPYQGLGDFQSLLSVIRLRNQQVIRLDSEFFSMTQVEGVFRVDIGPHSSLFLGFGDNMQREGGFAGGLRTINLDYSSARDAADSQRNIQTD